MHGLDRAGRRAALHYEEIHSSRLTRVERQNDMKSFDEG